MRTCAGEETHERSTATKVIPWELSELGVHALAGNLKHRPRAVTIGVFDGVHRGHQRLLAAIAGHPAPTVVTFAPHPREHFGQPVRLLTTVDRRVELLREHGAGDVVVLRFDRRLADMSAKHWAQMVLGGMGAEHVVVGDDFRFGAGRCGDAALLRDLGFNVTSVPLLDELGSTRVRQQLERGDLEAANRDLGRRPELELSLDSYVCTPAQRSFRCIPAHPQLQLPPMGSYVGVLKHTPVRLQLRLARAGAEAHMTSRVHLSHADLKRPFRVTLTRRVAD